MAAEYEVNIKINSQEIERQLGDIDKAVAKIGKPKGGSSRKKAGIAGILPSSEELKASERGIVQLIDRFEQRKQRAVARSNAMNEKALKLNKQLVAEARKRVRLFGDGFDGSRPKGRQLSDDINARAKAQDKRAKLANKINEMEAKGLNVANLRKQLGKATTEQARRRFAGAQKEFRLLQKTIELEQSKLQILKEQRKGFASSPIGGTRTMMGSPAQIAASAKAGGATSPIRGGLDFPGSPAFLAGATVSRTPFGPSFPTGGAFSPVRGGFNFPGSPIALAGATVSRTPFGPGFPTGGAALPIRGSTAIPGSPKAIQAAKATNLRALEVEASWSKTLKGLQDNAKTLKLSGVNTQTSWTRALTGLQDNAKVLRLRGVNTQTSWTRALTGLQDNAKVLRLRGVNTQTSWGKALGELQETAGILKLKDARIKQSWNVALQELQETAGMLKMKDARIKQSWAKALSKLEETAKDISKNREIQGRKRRGQRLEQVGLGAGFPLLFGGGAGSVIGGGLGGLTGSFGAQIAFSAIGQQIDQFVAGVVEAGKAFTSVGSAADFMAEKSLFSSDAMQFRIEKLIEEGKVSRAAALMTQEMAKQVGGTGLKALKDLGTEASKMGKLFGTVMLRIQAFMARALTPLIKLINSAIGGMVAQNQLDQMLAEAGSPERRAAILARSQELRGTKKQGRASSTQGDFTIEMLQTLQSEYPAIIPEGAAIEPTQLELLRAADTQSSQGKKEEARIQKRLKKLEEERKKVLEISRFKDKIAAANAAEDQQLVIRLQGEQKIAEIEAKRKKDLVDITDQRLIEQININAATEKLAAVRDTERELAELQRKRQEKFETTIENLDHQLALVRATTEEERERLRIEEALKKLREDDKLSQPQLDDIKTRMEALAEEKNLINTFIKETQAQIEKLNDPMFQIISLATTLGDAFSQSFRGIVDGSMSAQQALANLFQRTADHFLDMAAQMIAAQIKMQAVNLFMSFFSPNLGGGGLSTPASKSGTIPSLAPGLGGGTLSDPKGLFTPPTLIAQRALGGAVGAGRPYMVGERGPELFVPGAQGNIIPNKVISGANVTVNVDASGSSVEGDADQAAQLGKAIGVAVQQELIKQKRPGGLLTV